MPTRTNTCSAGPAQGTDKGTKRMGQRALPVNPRDYPKLDVKELGQIRHLVNMGNQLPGDWSGFGTQWRATDGSYGFQSGFSVMALALAQHRYTPAYREWYKKAIEGYISKLCHEDVAERVQFASRGGAWGGNSKKDMERGLMDPIIRDNNMMKGYILLTGAAYEMLYGDFRYEEPAGYTFLHHVWGYGNGQITFRYALSDIAQIIYREVLESNYVGCACETAQIFWPCNAVSNAGFILFDCVHGTHYSEVVPRLKDAWVRMGALDTRDFRVSTMVKTAWADRGADQRSGPAILPMNSWLGHWAGLFNNASDSEFTKAGYWGVDGRDREVALQFFLSGDYSRRRVDRKRYPESWHPFLDLIEFSNAHGNMDSYYSVLWGLYAACAAEVGDIESVHKLLEYAERNFGPVWQNGEYFYPRNDDFAVDTAGNSHGVDPWTGNVLLTLARLNKGDGLRNVFANAWTDAERAQPEVTNVNANTTSVSQAWWDANRKALIVTLQPGPNKAKESSFDIQGLRPDLAYDVIIDDRSIGTIRRGNSLGEGAIGWNDAGLSVSFPRSSERTFVFLEAGEGGYVG